MLRHIAAWFAVVSMIVMIAGGLGFYKYGELQAGKAAAAMAPEPMEAVGTARVRKGEWSAATRAIGTVVALRQLEIRNEIAGVVEQVGFESGAMVEAGQVLVQFDVRQETASLDAAKAEANLAKLTLDRRESLKSSAAFSPQEYDKARMDFAGATARVQNLEVAIDKKRIVAPFRGRIGITNLQPGAYLDVGTRIATMQGADPDAYVDFALPQDVAAAIRPGVTVTLSNPSIPSGSAPAEVVAEDDSVDRANRTVRFRAVAKGFGETFRPGMFVDVTAVTAEPREVVLAPQVSIRRSPNGQHVFILAEESGKLRARQRAVETGPVLGDDIVVEKGLAEGESIAASGSFKLRDGVLVSTDAPPAPVAVN